MTKRGIYRTQRKFSVRVYRAPQVNRDIVARLREARLRHGLPLFGDAAEEIERLRADNERLSGLYMEALKEETL